MSDYLVTVCSARCGYDASHQPPEVKRCPNCAAILVAVPVSLVDEWLSDPNQRKRVFG